jgi:hypothetical protein
LRGGKNHEAQREGRKAPDHTQCQFSAINIISGRSKPPDAAGLNDMNAKEIKGFPVALLR